MFAPPSVRELRYADLLAPWVHTTHTEKGGFGETVFSVVEPAVGVSGNSAGQLGQLG